MIIGFTGTQTGITTQQLRTLQYEVANRALETTEWHHGDCTGGDESFHELVVGSSKVVIHPPLDDSKRAFCDGLNVEIREPKEYLERDDDIAREVDVLIACPKGFKEELRSGTWATVRYARKYHKDVIIIYPDGSVEWKK